MFACPSDLPPEIGPLATLLNALKFGGCYFERITPDQRIRYLRGYVRSIKEGFPPSSRKRTRLEFKDNDGGEGSGDVERVESHLGPTSSDE